jgi:hypothetical protein
VPARAQNFYKKSQTIQYGNIQMGHIKNEIVRAAKDLELSFLELLEKKGAEIFYKIESKYVESKDGIFMWENLPEGISIQNEDAWLWIDKIVECDEIIMFFNPGNETTGFIFFSGKDIVKVLGETYHFEFYLTNKDLDYVLCFNNHNFLMVCGSLENKFARFLEAENLGEPIARSEN